MTQKPRKFALLALVTVFTLTLSSCSALSVTQQSGSLHIEGSKTSLLVPALWASSPEEGNPVGGIELATVTVDSSAPGAFHVELVDIQAQGAGPSWQAASGSAASFAALVGGLDPRTMSVHFDVTGPIDGPSAGGLLTVGLLAAAAQVPILTGKTMTGTISPDGSIGAVGYVSTKLKAAKEAGFSTVVIPSDSVIAHDSDGNEVDLVQYGRDFGLEVLPVRTVDEAFEALTGKSLFATADVSPTPQDISHEGREVAEGIQSRLLSSISSAESLIDERVLIQAQQAEKLSSQALLKGQWPEAYGVAAVPLFDLSSHMALSKTIDSISVKGFELTRDGIVKQAQSIQDSAQALLDTPVDLSQFNTEHAFSYPFRLSWLTWAVAECEAIMSRASELRTAEDLVLAAQLLSEQELAVSQFFPDSQSINSSHSGNVVQDECAISADFDAYTGLLNESGFSSMTYLQNVFGLSQNQPVGLDYDGLFAALESFSGAEQTDSTSPCDFATSAQGLARAMTFFSMSSAAVAAIQAYGIEPQPGGRLFAGGSPAEGLEASLKLARTGTADLLQSLEADGLNTSEQVWSLQWASAAVNHYEDTTMGNLASWVAINEYWGDVITLVLMRNSDVFSTE